MGLDSGGSFVFTFMPNQWGYLAVEKVRFYQTKSKIPWEWGSWMQLPGTLCAYVSILMLFLQTIFGSIDKHCS